MTRDITVRPDPIGRILATQGKLFPEAAVDDVTLLGPVEALSQRCIKNRPFVQQCEIQWALREALNIDQSGQNSASSLSLKEIQSKLKKVQPKFYKATFKLQSLFVDPETDAAFLLHDYLTKRSICALSYGTRIDCDDVIAITPEEGLVLNVTKETYQTLGLVGTELKVRGKSIGRYQITLDLLSLVTSKSKLAERVRWCFSHTYCQDITFLMAFTDPVTAKDIEAEALLDFLAAGAHKAYQTNLNIQKIKKTDVPNYAITSPTFASPFSAPLENACTQENLLELMEWSGAISCSLVNAHGTSDVLQSHNVCYEKGQTIRISWRGFLTPAHTERIYKLWSEAMLAAHSEPTSSHLQIGAFVSWGFDDSPISWRQRIQSKSPHTFHLSGENISFLFALPSLQTLPYLMVNATCPDDFAMA
ncbi:Ribonuclease P protein subunit p40 [Entomophthora muscae]|uniref:Ribonuclease P protein subunit p40 n=1 Tax=Entomophthora muscae TaxID=34485 RepID=A0ACC2SS53_9FUNG|nr:Ribonuclease P protein subunit p40 [Entomophthora muscae]